jgi:putative addiction module component (TIGR02574 family)
MANRPSKHPVDERIKLVEELCDSIVSDQKALPLTAEQKAELDTRLDAYEADGNHGRLASKSHGNSVQAVTLEVRLRPEAEASAPVR